VRRLTFLFIKFNRYIAYLKPGVEIPAQLLRKSNLTKPWRFSKVG